MGKIKKEPPVTKKEQKKHVKISEHPEELITAFRLLLNQCQKDNIQMPVARASNPLQNTKRDDLENLLSRLAKESIKVCKEAGCGQLIVKPFFAGVPRGKEWEVNRRYYLDLAGIARENGVVILLENQCRDVNGHWVRGICSDADEAVAWINRLNKEAGEERFGFCMDVGAGSLCGQNMQDFAVLLGERIKAVVLRDCDGHNETSMFPFIGIGWDSHKQTGQV